MSPAVVLTACYGGYDRLRPQVAQDIDVVWVAYTDDRSRIGEGVAPWTISFGCRSDDHPRIAAKRYKLGPGENSDVVWIDANTEIVDPSFVRTALAARRDGIAVFRHPDRDCIYAEADASLRLRPEAYANQPIAEQIAAYRAAGHPEHAGLYACGTVAWDWSTAASHAIAAAWWDEIERWSYQDQLSLPVVLRRLGFEPGILPARQTEERGVGWIGNRWQRIHPHLVAA